MKIKVGFLVAYDYNLLEHSLPLIYKDADEIFLSIDCNRTSYTGQAFFFDENFKQHVATIDTAKKIIWIEGNYYQNREDPMLNEGYHRNCLAEAMNIQPGDWCIQLDPDEFFIDFAGFVRFLKKIKPGQDERVSVSVYWKTIFKKIDNGYLMIKSNWERVEVATNSPHFKRDRRIPGHNVISSPSFMLHQSWARTTDEVVQKINNWSHARDFDTESFLKSWLRLNLHNYKSYKNFHPLHGEIWPGLFFVKAKHLKALIKYYSRYAKIIGTEYFIPQMFGKLNRLIKKVFHDSGI